MTRDVQPCIWCQHPTHGTLEHILPDALGCPPEFVLKKGVCRSCNNGLAHLDRALLKQFEIIAFINGVPRKNGKPPRIDSWAPLTAAYGTDGPEIHFNEGPETIAALGKRLPPAKAMHGIRDLQLHKLGNVGQVTFDQEFGNDPKFLRALYKVAMGSIAYFHGTAGFEANTYEPVRDFVRNGVGQFGCLMKSGGEPTQHRFGPHYLSPRSPYPVVEMMIFGVAFLLDFDPEQNVLKEVQGKMPSQEGWCALPLAPKHL